MLLACRGVDLILVKHGVGLMGLVSLLGLVHAATVDRPHHAHDRHDDSNAAGNRNQNVQEDDCGHRLTVVLTVDVVVVKRLDGLLRCPTHDPFPPTLVVGARSGSVVTLLLESESGGGHQCDGTQVKLLR